MYECSAELDQLNKAFISVRQEIINPSKDGDGANGKYRYLRLEALQDALYPLCNKNGLALKQWIYSDQDGRYRVMTSLYHTESKQWERSSVIIEPEMNQGPMTTDRDGNKRSVNTGIQQMGGSSSYWKRYCLMAVFGLTGGDDDNDGATSNALYNNSPKPTQSKTQKEFSKWLSSYQQSALKEAIGSDTYIGDELKSFYGIPYLNQIPDTKFNEALAMVKKIRNEDI